MKHPYNTEIQHYRGIPLLLIARKDYQGKAAKRFTLNNTNQNVWIPNKHLSEDGTIDPFADLDYVFNTTHAKNKLHISGMRLQGGIYVGTAV
ncbi:hypothetical protein C0431_12980 [bacterium]|nr:hypothetical protein [bacterium]